ncbi:MAG TPA: hypothetical protein PLO62_15220 [Candidatus Hydrogenedentes bacterium]|nr:hypothetical protein [Candidatus Hydrogenedentota bacterium]
MKRQHVITLIVALLLLGTVGGVYQFYFKVRLQQYARDEETKRRLETKLKQLETAFKGVRPPALIAAWRGAIQPWADAVNERAVFFDMAKLTEFQEVPEETMPKFHYEGQFYKMMQQLQVDAYNARISIPATTFGVPTPDQTRGQAPSREDVNAWLRQLSFGINVTRLLMQYGINPIRDVVIWPPRQEGNLLRMQTVGLSFATNLATLTKFLNELKTRDRYFNVDALQVTNATLRYPDPYLNVQMLVTVAQYTAPPSTPITAASESTAGSAVAAVQAQMGESRAAQIEAMMRARQKPWWKIWLPF